jgi:hypothetical protein
VPKPIYEAFALFPGLRQTIRWINGVKPTVTKKVLNGRSRGRTAGALAEPFGFENQRSAGFQVVVHAFRSVLTSLLVRRLYRT